MRSVSLHHSNSTETFKTGGRHDISDTSRDPCPYIIVYDIGAAFCMGAIGGSIWHGFKGYRNSPRGDRFAGTIASVKSRAPVVGGGFAVWSGLFNAGDCTLVAIRGKEDSWNAIMAGAATGGILAARSGPQAIAVSAAFGGIILGIMEGVGAMLGKLSSDSYKPVAPVLDLPPAPPAPSTNASASEGGAAAPSAPPKRFFQ
ncbi:Mitochondrial import inner membrane translocase subunit Tim17-A [Chytriomyces hyalinus]|nr:Mitochondrial import inner membrane translocase subunit Tim17-A [Chytriomyces hyalinus]